MLFIVKDELVKDLLGNINKTLIKHLLECKYGGDESAVPILNYLTIAPQAVAGLPASIICTESAGAVTYHFGKTLPETSAWLETLGGDKLNWIHALVMLNIIIQGTSYINNPLHCILTPHTGQKIIIKYSGSMPTSITIYGATHSYGNHVQGFKALEIIYKKAMQSMSPSSRNARAAPSHFLSNSFISLPRALCLSMRSQLVIMSASRCSTGNCGTAMMKACLPLIFRRSLWALRWQFLLKMWNNFVQLWAIREKASRQQGARRCRCWWILWSLLVGRYIILFYTFLMNLYTDFVVGNYKVDLPYCYQQQSAQAHTPLQWLPYGWWCKTFGSWWYSQGWGLHHLGHQCKQRKNHQV